MSTTLPHGIIQINEGNISWYGDITANWQLIDGKIGIYDAAIATIPAPANNGTLTINYGGTTIAMFGADDSGNVTADIPAPGDGTLTIQKNGTNVATFTANQSTSATANITVPVNTSDLVNDSGYLTASSNLDASKLTSGTVDIARLPQGALERLVKVANEAARYALTTADVQLGDTVQQLDTGIMYIVTDADHLDSAAGYTEYTAGTAASVPWSGVTGKPTFAAVATSGAYSDLTGTPTIPTVNNATLTIQRNGTTVDTFTANASVDKTININTADDTKIPLAGSNAISGSLIPATTDAYDLGGSSYQWNNAYIKSLTINGVACGDILTHNVSEFVNVTGAQTIGGVKTFSAAGCTFWKQIKINHNLEYGKNNPPSQPAFHNLMFTGANGWWGSYVENVTGTNGNSTLAFYVRNTNEIQSRVYLECGIDGSFSMYPLSNNVWDLGTSTNKWKDVNTVLLNGKTPAYSTDIPTKVSQLTNDSGFLTSADLLPTGSYIQFAGSQAPAGFLVCNGGEISRTTYSQLFAVIGTTYGSGDGSTTFNLPNLTDRFLQGSTTSGTVKNAGLPNITGSLSAAPRYTGNTRSDTVYAKAGAFSYEGSESWASDLTTESAQLYSWHDIGLNASNSNSIYGNSTTVQPPALTCLICIKY